MCHLAVGMHARVRTAGTLHRDRDAEEVTKHPLQFPLHGAQARLRGLCAPAVELAAVVGDVEAQTNQPVTGYSGDGLIR